MLTKTEIRYQMPMVTIRRLHSEEWYETMQNESCFVPQYIGIADLELTGEAS